VVFRSAPGVILGRIPKNITASEGGRIVAEGSGSPALRVRKIVPRLTFRNRPGEGAERRERQKETMRVALERYLGARRRGKDSDRSVGLRLHGQLPILSAARTRRTIDG
jgi:hypothetical protein